MLQSSLWPAHAVGAYHSGLKSGDSAYYELSGSYGFYPSMPETHMTVLGVTGTNISAGFTDFFPDGPLSPNVYWLDVFTGEVRNVSSNVFFAVTPGLILYDPIFNGGQIKISNTQSILCGGVSRTIVTAQFSNSGQTVQIGWDQDTGVMCRLNATDQNQFGFLQMAMKNTTLWGSASAPSDVFTIAANISAFLGLPLVALIVFVYYRRRRPRRRVSLK